MSQYVTKIRTNSGDLQIDYNALANKPELNTMFSNPNLLINSDFRNPVNQRGETILTTNDNEWTKFYFIDRWYTQHGTTLELLDGCIKASASSTTTSGYFCQVFEQTLSSDTYTATINVKSISGTVNLYLKNNDEPSGINLTQGINVFTTTKPISSMEIQLLPGSTIEIYWAKLEVGSFPTKFIPRLLVDELALCYRYYQCIECRLLMNVLTSELAQGVYYFAIPMRYKPSKSTITDVTYYKFADKTFVSPSSSVVHNMYINDKHAVIQVNKNGGDTFTAGNCISVVATLTFDAEIY